MAAPVPASMSPWFKSGFKGKSPKMRLIDSDLPPFGYVPTPETVTDHRKNYPWKRVGSGRCRQLHKNHRDWKLGRVVSPQTVKAVLEKGCMDKRSPRSHSRLPQGPQFQHAAVLWGPVAQSAGIDGTSTRCPPDGMGSEPQGKKSWFYLWWLHL
jgi:hypothetical protein